MRANPPFFGAACTAFTNKVSAAATVIPAASAYCMNSRRETFPFAASDFILSRSVIECSSTVSEIFRLLLLHMQARTLAALDQPSRAEHPIHVHQAALHMPVTRRGIERVTPMHDPGVAHRDHLAGIELPT